MFKGSVVQLAETADLKSVQCGFESHPSYQFNNAPVAQWLEQGSHKPLVAGSSPAGRTN